MSNYPGQGQGRGGGGAYSGPFGGGAGGYVPGPTTVAGNIVHHVHSGCVHVHHDQTGSGTGDLSAVLTELAAIRQLLTEAHLSDIPAAITGLTDAIAAVTARVDADVAHLQDLLNQALTTSADNAAEVARLQAEAATVVDSITSATSSLAAIDPLTDFPSVTGS